VAIFALLLALLATAAAGLPLRDPGHVAARRLAIAVALSAALVAVDAVARARRPGELAPSLAEVRRVARERWTVTRAAAVAGSLVGFHVTYLAYRNLKSVVPLLEPGTLFDDRLARLDRALFAGHDPAALLQSVLGTGIAAQLLSLVYGAFFVFVPLALGGALVLLRDLRAGLFLATALSINWVLAAGSYFLVPALGPVYADPTAFAGLPETAVGDLQTMLLGQRALFLLDPAAAGTAQSIGAFASLHVSMLFTAAVAAHLLGLGPRLKVGLWTMLALTVTATIYFGWHYVIDDIGGMILALLALALARAFVGVNLRSARQRRTLAPAPVQT
jgi:hypothetical protein